MQGHVLRHAACAGARAWRKWRADEQSGQAAAMQKWALQRRLQNLAAAAPYRTRPQRAPTRVEAAAKLFLHSLAHEAAAVAHQPCLAALRRRRCLAALHCRCLADIHRRCLAALCCRSRRLAGLAGGGCSCCGGGCS